MFFVTATLTEFLRLRAEICRDLLSVSRAVDSLQHTCESLTRSLEQSRQELSRAKTDIEAERALMERKRSEFDRREQQLLAQAEESKRANSELSKQVYYCKTRYTRTRTFIGNWYNFTLLLLPICI